MLPKTLLTSHSRMSGSRWVITPWWLSGSWRSFLYSSSVYFCHLSLIYPVLLGPFHLSFIVWNVCMKCSLGISNFPEEMSSLSHSMSSSMSLNWSLRKAFLSLLAILWNSAFKWVYLSFSLLPLASLFLFSISSSHRTGKGQFSFQSQRKAIPKNAQTTAQLHSSHKLAK